MIGEVFNAGIIEYGDTKTVRDIATKKIVSENEFVCKGHLYFKYENIRQQDYDLYGSLDKTIDLKVKTHFVKEALDANKVRYYNKIYDIAHIDPDKDMRYLYWYLTKVVD